MRSRRTLLSTLLAAIWSVSPAASLPIEHPIVFVKQTPVPYTFATISDIFGNFQGYYPPEEQPVGGNLFRLDPDGTLTNLTGRSNAAVRDPEISYDGSRVLFSMKTGGMGRWQVYEMNVDGSGLRKVSRNASHHDLDPAYLPDGRIVFTTDRGRWADGYENLPAAQIALMRADGTAVQILKRHPHGQLNPLVGSDGMLYFTQWDFHDRRDSIEQNNSDFDVNRFLLWKIFADGSGLDHPAFGTHTLYDFVGGYTEVRELPGRPDRFVGVLADEFFTFGAGSIVEIVLRQNANLEAPIFLTPNVFETFEENSRGRWRSPYPLAGGDLVASYAPGAVVDGEGTPKFRLVTLRGDGSNQQTLYSDPAYWCWQPVEAAPRAVPPLAAGQMRPQFPYAMINSLDVTLRETNENVVVNGDFQDVPAPGQAKTLRVWREDVRTPNLYGEFPQHADPDIAVLGTAPIHPDGSFAVLVPADVPIQWDVLDAGGQVLVRERFGTELRAGEVRRCNGCHSPHDGRVGNTTNLALASPTNLSGKNVDVDGNGVVDLLEDSEPCRPSATVLCLRDGRFRVESSWRDFTGNTGTGQAAALTADTGTFWFFDSANVELMVKVLDGRPLNGHFWVFYGALSNVEFSLVVTDTVTRRTKTYFNPSGNFASVGDTEAL